MEEKSRGFVPRWLLALIGLVLLGLAVGESGGVAAGGVGSLSLRRGYAAPSVRVEVNRGTIQSVPLNDAYLEFRPQAGGPPNGGTVNVGARFVLEMWLVAGTHTDLTAQQSYLTWTHQLLQNVRVDQIATSCVLTNSVTAITTVFDAVLQNQVCNGPAPCKFATTVDPGSYAFASGALINAPAGGQFKVAEFGICAAAPGTATLRWEFSPPSPPTRDTQILDVNGNIVSNSALFTNYVINVMGGSPSPTATSTTPTPTPCAVGFSDVTVNDYFYEAVRFLYCMGAVSGYADNTFRPYNFTTRGQLSKIVVLAEQWPIYTPPTPTFLDVLPTDTFYQYIETAYNRGIISGYADRTFRPGNNVTRGQLCKIIVLAEGWTLLNPPTPTFLDVPQGDPFYQHIETAYDRAVISGYADRTFRPGNPATRGQICKIVYNALQSPR